MEGIYKIKHCCEDFVVHEVPLMPTFSTDHGRSRFTYCWLKKRGYTTFQAVETIAKHLGVPVADIAHQGLKDETAVTSQIISIDNILTVEQLDALNSALPQTDSYIRLQHIIGFGDRQVDTRHLHGNTFTIVVRDLAQDVADRFFAFCKNNRFISFVNYYDDQRFGMDGGPYNTHLIGQAMVAGDWQTAYHHFSQTKNMTPDLLAAGHGFVRSQDYKNFFKLLSPNKLSFFVAAHNSWGWNAVASAHVASDNDGVLHAFPHQEKLFVPAANRFSCNTTVVMDGNDINSDTLMAQPKVIERNTVTTTTVYPLAIWPDDLHPGRMAVTVSFFLPTGCYATMLLRQIFIKIL